MIPAEPFHLGDKSYGAEPDDTTLRKARERLEESMERLAHPDDHVKPENLQVDS